ncbi:hypothetical protein LZ30DRAFT_481529 [Colletotrichum cereale]|nr:hypothetical protein LZ30DRAFT_481529 [Colletotrichum cereale]
MNRVIRRPSVRPWTRRRILHYGLAPAAARSDHRRQRHRSFGHFRVCFLEPGRGAQSASLRGTPSLQRAPRAPRPLGTPVRAAACRLQGSRRPSTLKNRTTQTARHPPIVPAISGQLQWRRAKGLANEDVCFHSKPMPARGCPNPRCTIGAGMGRAQRVGGADARSAGL